MLRFLGVAEGVLREAGYRAGADAFEVAVCLGYRLDPCWQGEAATQYRTGGAVIVYDGRLLPAIQRSQVLRELARHGLEGAGMARTEEAMGQVAVWLASLLGGAYAKGPMGEPAKVVPPSAEAQRRQAG
jgi:hypothetical protein